MLATLDWTNVIIALIAGLPAIISAVGVLRVRHDIKTPSGEKIGKVVESAHDTGIANNLLLKMLRGEQLDPEAPGRNQQEGVKND